VNNANVKALLLSLLPRGTTDWMDFSEGSDLDRLFEGLAVEANRDGYATVDNLVANSSPATSTVPGNLPEWEAALQQAVTSASGTGQREDAIVARLRESGASTIPNIKAALSLVVGYEPAILEHERSWLTTQHTYPISNSPVAIAAGPFVSSFGYVNGVTDNAPISQAGARLSMTITHPAIEDLEIHLTCPDGGTVGFASLGTGPIVGKEFLLYAPTLQGHSADGQWVVSILNNGGDAGSLSSGAVTVEGIGRNALSGAEGKGSAIFEWAALIDPALASTTADLALARKLVSHWNPAHCRGYLAVVPGIGGVGGVFDDPTSVFNGCVWA